MINLETILRFEYKILVIIKPHKRRRALTITILDPSVVFVFRDMCFVSPGILEFV